MKVISVRIVEDDASDAKHIENLSAAHEKSLEIQNLLLPLGHVDATER